MPITLSTRATITKGRPRLNVATAVIQPERMSTHSKSEPSWLPHKAENLKMGGSRLLELAATTATEKSSCKKLTANRANATATKTVTPTANEGAIFMAATSRRAAPHIGTTASPIASTKAIISATWPSSGITVGRAGLAAPFYLQVRQRPRGACSFHRAWPAPVWPPTSPTHPTCLLPQRPRPRQTGRAGCR